MSCDSNSFPDLSTAFFDGLNISYNGIWLDSLALTARVGFSGLLYCSRMFPSSQQVVVRDSIVIGSIVSMPAVWAYVMIALTASVTAGIRLLRGTVTRVAEVGLLVHPKLPFTPCAFVLQVFHYKRHPKACPCMRTV